MGQNLLWEPVKVGRSVGSFSLRDILLNAGAVARILDGKDLHYLRGLNDAGIEGADELMEAIMRYNKIRVWKE